jgi:secreted trypsin-like serine protease
LEKRIKIRLGEKKISTEVDCNNPNVTSSCNTDNPPHQDIEVEKVIVHENYDKLSKLNDIALIKLKHPVKLEGIKNIKTICLPTNASETLENFIKESKDEDEDYDDEVNEKDKANDEGGVSLKIAGWGTTENSTESYSDDLLFNDVKFVEGSECNNTYDNVIKNKLIHPKVRVDVNQFVSSLLIFKS